MVERRCLSGDVEEVARRTGAKVVVLRVLEAFAERLRDDLRRAWSPRLIEKELRVGEVDIELRDIVGAGMRDRFRDGTRGRRVAYAYVERLRILADANRGASNDRLTIEGRAPVGVRL